MAIEQSDGVVLSQRIKRTTPMIDLEPLKWAKVKASSVNDIRSDIIYDAPYFVAEDGTELGLSHLFYVKLFKEKDVDVLTNLALDNNVSLIGNNEYMPLWYTLSCSNNSTGNALELANKFYETGRFDAAQPDLMSNDLISCVNDQYFSTYQWNLNNTGQSGGTVDVDVKFCNARSLSQGSNSIVVAVFDQGIQLNHPDLNIYSSSYDTESGTSPSVLYGTHGTNCAGFISAKTNNSIGIAAIAPDCPSMSVSNSLAATPDSRQKRADGINWAWRNNASVISNSWGSSVQYTIIDDAIYSALTNGRSGKGCVIVFASGNDYSSSVAYPANSHSDIIAVGSINRNGNRSSFSNYGTALDIVAPGEDLTSTTTGSGYIHSISGTSFACPHVAATAALILSVNPDLTQKQVVNIIESTAAKTGNYSYITTPGRGNGTWNNEMGYGLLNTFAAVSAAANDNVYFNDRTVSSSLFVSGWNIFTQNVTVTSGATLTFSMGNQITINAPYTINGGSQLVISY